MIRRYSSKQSLSGEFLRDRLEGAQSYDRIAGYFSSSLLEVAGEAIDSMSGKVRIICNSDLMPDDVRAAASVSESEEGERLERHAQGVMRKEWTGQADDAVKSAGLSRFERLAQLLASGKLEVRVLPNERFGLIHGKAGVITMSDGSKTSFLGSVNESKTAWERNYELLWEDDDRGAVEWVQNEFDALWDDQYAVKLADAVIQDINRIAQRKVVSLDEWRKDKPGGAAGAMVENPIYRKELGLWAHQKYFVDLAYKAHTSGKGARYILADMVGLGKTVQLAVAAQLMALHDEKPVLVIAPKTLVHQWQQELWELLGIPSAVWDGRRWHDEHGGVHGSGIEEDRARDLGRCPRMFGIVSQSTIIYSAKDEQSPMHSLYDRRYACIVVDECHRARRKNLKRDGEQLQAEPNNLMRFLLQLADRAPSVLLATATPVQLYPIEAYDLLEILAQGNMHVLGDEWSYWRSLGERKKVLEVVMGQSPFTDDLDRRLGYMRNPLPCSFEGRDYEIVRRQLGLTDDRAVIPGNLIADLDPQVSRRLMRDPKKFFEQYNPFIRHIVRRTRGFLESTLDPSTGETYLKAVKVRLFGEDKQDSVLLDGSLLEAYQEAENFSKLLGKRLRSAGFIKSLLLRRMGSSIEAGRKTVEKMLGDPEVSADRFVEDDLVLSGEEESKPTTLSEKLIASEKAILSKVKYHLEAYLGDDPKLAQLKSLLLNGTAEDRTPWMDYGCMIFSQYVDTARYMAEAIAKDTEFQCDVGLYAGGNNSGLYRNGVFERMSKEELKRRVKSDELKILFGSDAASEGLNLQRLGTLINVDLPWNPTRLEQRKGRIQRIGQRRDTVYVFNMRYHGSVEDRVHTILSERLEQINDLFGQIPDVLEDVWIQEAMGEREKAKELIDSVPLQHPFEMKYNRVENIDWESYSTVLNDADRTEVLSRSWGK